MPPVPVPTLKPIKGFPGQFTDGGGKGGRDPDTGNSYGSYNVYDASGEYLGQNATVVIDGVTTNYGYSYGTQIPKNVDLSASTTGAPTPVPVEGAPSFDPGVNAPEGTAASAEEALAARSDALNQHYGLGEYQRPGGDSPGDRPQPASEPAPTPVKGGPPGEGTTNLSMENNANYGSVESANAALGARSQALNQKYGLGDYAPPGSGGASAIRSQSQNQQNGLGDDTQPLPGSIAPSVKDPMYGIDPPGEITGSGSPMNQRGMETAASQSASQTIGHAQSGLEARSEALNEAYGLGSSSSASSAPAWHVNPHWAAVDGTSSAAISAAGVDPGQVLETRPGANNNTLLRMKDGTYQSIESNGNVTSAGHWDNSQWAGSGYDTQVNTAGNTISPASPAIDSIGPPPIVEQPLTAGRLETSPLDAQGAAITSTDNSVLGGITLPASDTGGSSSPVDNLTSGENASAGRSIAD